MKSSRNFFLVIYLILFPVIASATDSDAIRNAVSTKFNQSSKGVVKKVTEESGMIQIYAEKGGIGDSHDIVIDVAVALNRINNGIKKWKTVIVTVDKTRYVLARADFDSFRQGKINDSQFISRLKRK